MSGTVKEFEEGTVLPKKPLIPYMAFRAAYYKDPNNTTKGISPS